MATSYQRSYYSFLSGAAPKSASEIIPIVREFVEPKSVVDIGCGAGGWLAEFIREGITDVAGVDGPWIHDSQLLIPKECFRVADLTKTVTFPRRFDLVMNLEVAEHLSASSAETLVATLTGLGNHVLFSAAIPFQGGENHVNEQWPEYWAELFQVHQFTFIDCLRARIWKNPRVDWWYAQNIFLVVRDSEISRNVRLQRAFEENSQRPLAIVHPRAYEENVARAKRPVELVMATLGSVKRNWLKRR